MRTLPIGLVLVLLVACSHEPAVTPTSSASTPAAATTSRATSSTAQTARSGPASSALSTAKPGSLLARIDRSRLQAQLREIPQPITFHRQCVFRDETGYNGTALVDIANNEVRALSTTINVPDRGACNFDMAGFQQTQRSPSIELRHKGDGCTVRIWRQGRQLTISYSRCARRCASPETFAYVWPVLIDMGSSVCD